MDNRLKLAYSLAVVLLMLAYPVAREVMIAQQQVTKGIVVSTLMVNYVLAALVLGAIVPKWIVKHYDWPGWAIVPVSLVVGGVALGVFKLVGLPMKF